VYNQHDGAVILGCSKRSGRDKDVSFFRLPKVVSNKGEEIYSLSKRRRDGFLAAISRVGLTDTILKNDRICSRHFISGKPADLLDHTNPDWLPSLNLGHNKAKLSSTATERWERRNARQLRKEEAAQSIIDSTVVEPSVTDDTSTDAATQTAEAAQSIIDSTVVEPSVTDDTSTDAATQTADIARKDACIQIGGVNVIEDTTQTDPKILIDASTQTYQDASNFLPPFSEEALLRDEYVKFYTGLPSCKVLKTVFNHVKPAISHYPHCKLAPFQEFMIVLMKLRLNAHMQDLAYRFNISLPTISRMFWKWIKVMNCRLRHLIFWPDRDALMKTMPVCFQECFGKKVAVIIDCFEVFLERPSNLHARACTWSNYKHHNTVKVLLGISPQGVISYVSETWGGRVSDKYITEHCGVLDHLIPGDVVLADRGFDISDSVGMMQACLNIPAFTKGKSQLSALEVHETRTIANVRIHVERVIGNVRQKYSILQSTLPIQYVHKREGQSPIIDSIVTVCCALCNVCDSVVPFD